ncbi:hypothetical protein SAMN02745206_01014 [Desulfacinum infernum DSM 9756]|uniref:HepT-like domain-containing protein n=1 Tax=Desulfacinum infernum DSM 9756 TaxID=1121391 RepID=A0A1M4X8J0_9BACT|nr:hypothetical protein [Desulfacinum infernum]SHE89809.1 hypothetical protein SAMN02745206_01014 [Desulfacinum infernum DSM 9756]
MEGIHRDSLIRLEELNREISAVERKVSRLKRLQDPEDIDSYIRAIASAIQSAYTGMEKILKEILRTYDGSVPSGEDWHVMLLKRAVLPDPGNERPAVISRETMESLDLLRSFRHVVRHVYHYNLHPERVLEQAGILLAVAPGFQREILEFLEVMG